MNIFEGGNVFKDEQGTALTRRILKAEIPGTIRWLESVTGLDLSSEMDPNTGYPLKWLGSTGKKPDSGDLDLAVDMAEISKPQLRAQLEQFVKSQGQDPRDFVRLTGEAVHFRTPIMGQASKGFVQTDFMFMPDLNWGTFFLAGGQDSAFKGSYRNVLMSSIARTLGLRVGAKGMYSRASGNLLSMDPDYVAQALLGQGSTRRDLRNVESIYARLQRDPDRDEKLKDFREYIARDGLSEPSTMSESDVNFLARLRDRIVNQGMTALIESQLDEAEQAGVGGRAKGIEHLEDLVFRRGTQGIRDALAIVKHASAEPARTTTVKWDGRPAVIFGRKPSTGEFVLTDGAGFDARGYDGLATSPAMMADIQRNRSGDREGIIRLYAALFPVLERALPSNFRGYVKGDLLYMNTPPVESGNYVFRPNTVEYRIPVKSALGQRIGTSEIGVAMHTMYADQGEPRQPLSRVRFIDVPGLLLIEPGTSVPRSIEPNPAIVTQLKNIVRVHGAHIDTLFNPTELRAHRITDLAKLAVDYVNTRVGAPLDSRTLLPEFGTWLQKNVTPQKFRNIVEYLQSPKTNTSAMAAAFTAFILLNDLKEDIRAQLDAQHPGQEGWVMATPAGYAKAVGRFDPAGFAAQNRARNNPV